MLMADVDNSNANNDNNESFDRDRVQAVLLQ